MRLGILLLSALALTAFARPRDPEPDWDSLPPRMQYYYRLKSGLERPSAEQDHPDSLNVRMVGKWGRGPAASVTGRDTLVYVGMGSEVAVFNAVDASNPRIINEIQCYRVVSRVILKDNLLYVVMQGALEVFDITDPSRATRIRYLEIGLVDMCIRDSLAYMIDGDSFKVYRIVSPESLARVGACSDSGYYITADQGFAYVCNRWGLYIIDATDPIQPRRASAIPSEDVQAAWAEAGYCYYTHRLPGPAFVVADVSDPYHPFEAGRRSGLAGYDIYKIGFYVYLPAYTIVDVSNPSNVGVIGSLSYGGNGVWTKSPFSHSFLAAGFAGLSVISISDPVHPFLDTALAGAWAYSGISCDGAIACVAGSNSAMEILSIRDPARPEWVGRYETAGVHAEAVEVRDSIAYVLTLFWPPYHFRTVDISDPVRPQTLGGCVMWNPGQAIRVCDSLAYVAEHYRLEIFNISNSRAPRLVGSCRLPNFVSDMSLQDTIAYIASSYLCAVSVADPARPRMIDSFDWDAVASVPRDTLLYVARYGNGLFIYNIKDLHNPVLVGAYTRWGGLYDVALLSNRVILGERYGVYVVDVSDPASPVEVGHYTTPHYAMQVCVDSPLVYVVCFDAGVCILELTPEAITESHNPEQPGFHQGVISSPVRGTMRYTLNLDRTARLRAEILDGCGRRVSVLCDEVARPGKKELVWNGRTGKNVAAPGGIYFLRLTTPGRILCRRFVFLPD